MGEAQRIYSGKVELSRVTARVAVVSGVPSALVMLTLDGGGFSAYCFGSPAAMRELGKHLISAADASEGKPNTCPRCLDNRPVAVKCLTASGAEEWLCGPCGLQVADRNTVQVILRSAVRASDTRPETEHSDADPGL